MRQIIAIVITEWLHLISASSTLATLRVDLASIVEISASSGDN
jgi:hypothetical protein